MRTPQPGYNTKVHATISIDRNDLEQARQLALWRGTNVSYLLADLVRLAWKETKSKGQSTATS
jgi:hypothetical protein